MFNNTQMMLSVKELVAFKLYKLTVSDLFALELVFLKPAH